MKNSFKKLVCTALSGILFVSAAALPSFAKKEKTPLKKIEYRPMFRLYNPLNHEHFYTESTVEKNTLTKKYGWVDEGIGWTAPSISKTPVYRLYNPILRDHHYTTSKVERDKLVAKDHWKDEGIGWYSDDNKGKPLYRQFAPFLTSGSHNYTTDPNERKVLTKQRGWVDEGISWYGVDKPKENKPTKPIEKNPKEEIINFTEDDVEKIANELGIKYNRELNPDNAGWAGICGRGFLLSEIDNLADVKGFIIAFQNVAKHTTITECRLIMITPENFNQTYMLDPEKHNVWRAIGGNAQWRIDEDFEKIKNGAKAYIFCYR